MSPGGAATEEPPIQTVPSQPISQSCDVQQPLQLDEGIHIPVEAHASAAPQPVRVTVEEEEVPDNAAAAEAMPVESEGREEDSRAVAIQHELQKHPNLSLAVALGNIFCAAQARWLFQLV